MKPTTIAPVGRRRANQDNTLEPRLYLNRGSYFYVHRNTGKWESLGKDKAKANERAKLYNDPTGNFGTMVYWLGMFLVDCEARVKAGLMSKRTLDDYTLAIKPKDRKDGTASKSGALAAYFAPPITPLDVDPEMVNDFLEDGALAGRPVPANREKAALSSCFGWLIRKGKVPGLKMNPCLRGSGIVRNPERKRERYVTDDDYRDVWAEAPTSVRLLLELTYRSLQRPESDIIHWTTQVLLTEDGKPKLHFRQGKTGKWMKVGVSRELDALMRASLGDVPKLFQPIVRKKDGTAYTYDGISSMLKRSIVKANAKRRKENRPAMAMFGFRDMKGKGATDMWRAGVPIEEIQLLCGHADKNTTEIYVKQRWHETAKPNAVVQAWQLPNIQ